MRSLAFDISSSNTGWSLFDVQDNKIGHFEYGNIAPVATVNIFQKLFFFGKEIERVISKYTPDEIAFEESVQVISHGFKTAKVLARFSGVGLFFAFDILRKPIHLYEPTMWRKEIGLSGRAHKTEVLFFVVSQLCLLNSDQIKHYSSEITNALKITSAASNLKDSENDLKNLVKKEQDKEVKKILQARLKKLKECNKDKLKLIKSNKKEIQKNFESIMKKIGVNIYLDSGITLDIADSFGVNFCLLKELGVFKC